MPLIKESDLKKQIKAKQFGKLFFLFGEEKYLVKFYTEQLAEKIMGKSPSDFNLQVFHGTDSTVDEIAEAVEALPVLAEKKCVVVNDLDVEALNAQSISKLNELVSDLPDTSVLIISLPTLSIEVKKSAKWKNFISLAQKSGIVAELEKRETSVLEKQISDLASKRGCVLSLINAGHVIQLCGDDLLTLNNELEKLCAYAAGREITRQDIETVVTKNLETTVFLLAKALLAREYDNVYRQLDQLFYQREEPVAVLAVLSSAYVDMYRVKAILESGEQAAGLTKSFDYKNKEFRIRNAERDCRRISIEVLRESINILLETDIRLKSSRMDKHIIMEEMVAKLLLVSERGI